jgi:hypothetical protein
LAIGVPLGLTGRNKKPRNTGERFSFDWYEDVLLKNRWRMIRGRTERSARHSPTGRPVRGKRVTDWLLRRRTYRAEASC